MNKNMTELVPESSEAERTPFQAFTASIFFGILSFLYLNYSGYYARQILLWEDYLVEVGKHVLLWSGLTVLYFGVKNTWSSFQCWLTLGRYWRKREIIKNNRISRKLLANKVRKKYEKG